MPPAVIDQLTGLPRPWRDSAGLHLEDAFPPAARLRLGDSLFVVDVVEFRYVNDWWGHAHGDEVLRSVAAILVQAAGERPVWRFGGDEFLVMATGGATQALPLAKLIRDRVRALGEGCPGRPMDVAIGIAVGRGSDTAELLLGRAYQACFMAGHLEERIVLE